MKVELDLGTETLRLGDRLKVEKKIQKIYENINYRVVDETD